MSNSQEISYYLSKQFIPVYQLFDLQFWNYLYDASLFLTFCAFVSYLHWRNSLDWSKIAGLVSRFIVQHCNNRQPSFQSSPDIMRKDSNNKATLYVLIMSGTFASNIASAFYYMYFMYASWTLGPWSIWSLHGMRQLFFM